MKRPTRIIMKPQNSCGTYQITCNDMKTYNLAELAKKIGVVQSTLGQRLQRYKWSDKRVLYPFRFIPKREYEQDCPFKDMSDLTHLSATHNRYGERIYGEEEIAA